MQGLAADGQMIEHEGAGGKITYLSNPDHHRSGNHRPSPWEVADSAEPPEPKERHSQGRIAREDIAPRLIIRFAYAATLRAGSLTAATLLQCVMLILGSEPFPISQ